MISFILYKISDLLYIRYLIYWNNEISYYNNEDILYVIKDL